MSLAQDRRSRRKRRTFRIRKKISGQADTPRLSLFRSTRHIYVQAVDDTSGTTLASASTQEKELQGKLKGYAGNRESAVEVGKLLAERLKKIGVTKAVFDRGGFRYHGRVKALADAAREGGIKF